MTARPTVAATAWPPINQPTADTTIAGSDIFCQRFLELAKRVESLAGFQLLFLCRAAFCPYSPQCLVWSGLGAHTDICKGTLTVLSNKLVTLKVDIIFRV